MDRIHFKVNGKSCSVGCEVSSRVMLVDYIRDTLELRGTKFMCREGGCGVCIVSVTKRPGGPVLAVNSCMVPITSCQNWDITTIEEIGNRKKGYNILQKKLAEYNGSQCGYCSPAWVMNMHSFLESNPEPSQLEVEKAFGSNICRCTGYRPILDAFKSFAKDYTILDIEELSICKKTGVPCAQSCDREDEWCIVNEEDVKANDQIQITLKDNKCFYKVSDLHSVFQILDARGYDSYMLVFGNTARGAYPITEYPNTLIDISTIPDLKVVETDQNLIVGAGLTITELQNTFKSVLETDNFGYLVKLVEHLDLVAHIPVRNLGSVGGNLMIKHQHNEFPSDIFLLFQTVGAYLTIMNSKGISKDVSMQQFLLEDMKGKIIVKAMLPPLNPNYKIETFKIMPRSQNAHAIVNAGFLYELTSSNIVKTARISFGGLSAIFNRARLTETFLKGKCLFSDQVLQRALQVLNNELIVVEDPPANSAIYRKKLSLALFYKGLLSLCPNNLLNPKYISGATKIHCTRPVSRGEQHFETDPSMWPINKPITKVEALIQCAGEAKYTDDIQTQPSEVHAAFVLSTVAVGDIVRIDASKALAQPGVLTFYSAKDIPGINSFIPLGAASFYASDEEVFCSGAVKYFNQAIGVIVAETQAIANVAAKLVTATYKNIKTPVLDIKVASEDPNRLTLLLTKEATDIGTDVAKVIKGENTIYGQCYITTEIMSCLTIPNDDGLAVYATSHWLDAIQVTVSRALNIHMNHIEVYVTRLGGSFGLKLSRTTQVAIACSLVTVKLNRPCRMVLSLETTTRMFGKRRPCYNEFECSVNKTGVIQHIDYKSYEDNGYVASENLSFLGLDAYYNCYNNARFDYTVYGAITDTAKNTWFRAPGSFENVSMAEYMIEQISYELSLDPFDVRFANLSSTYEPALRQMAEDLKTSASYDERRAAVDLFNTQNRWKKRGIRTSFLRYTPIGAPQFEVNLSVYHDDGSVVITHAGIDMGQGVNTVAVQICAYMLKIPTDLVQIKPNNTIIAPNCIMSGGSLTTQYAGLGVRQCCEDLLKRLEPIRQTLNNPSWKTLIQTAYLADTDLQVHRYVDLSSGNRTDVFGVAIAEVEVDVLTGESENIRVDILQDVGQSINQELDVGQVEGAFIMSQGYWTSESLVHKKTGELLTDRTWEYYVPLARDIPQDFRISFRKNSYSFERIFGSKVTGEPPTCLSIVVAFALRAAIAAARKDVEVPTTQWFPIAGPYTVEKISLATLTDFKHFNFK